MLYFRVDSRPVFHRIRTIGRLHRKLIDPLQHIMHFIQSTFRRLDITYPFRNIAHSLVQAAHLPAHLLGNR